MTIYLGKRTSAPSFLHEGYEFACYRTGISRTVWATADGKLWCSRNKWTGTGSTYSAYIETGADYPERIGKLFRSEKTACKALVAYVKAQRAEARR